MSSVPYENVRKLLAECTCPWNTVEHLIINGRGHNRYCGSLRLKHSPNDGCGRLGHKDEEVSNGTT